MQCPSCGNMLTPGVTSCPRCLAFVPYNALAASGTTGPASQQTTPAGYSSWQPPAYPNQAVYPPMHYPQQNFYAPGMPPYQPVAQVRPTPRKPFARPTVTILVLLALLLMFSGFGLIYYTAVAHPIQLRAQATATVQAFSRSTAAVNAQASSTAVANTKISATAQARATVQGQATASAYQGLYTQATGGAPVISSPLAFQDNSNWDVYDTNDGGGCSFVGGALHSNVLTKGYYVPCFARNTNVTNFAFQVQMIIVKGDEGGLLFRANPSTNQYYFFMVSRGGYFSLYLSKDKQHNLSIAGDNSNAIKTTIGDPNLLTVIGKGSTFYLYINKQFAGSVNDPSFASGQIGVFGSDHTNTTEVAFKNAQVWAL